MLEPIIETRNDLEHYRNKVKNMFIHAYDSYMQYAYPLDELMPLSCSGMKTWGNFSLTLIDSLDTLLVLKNESEFEKAVNIITSTINFDMDINVSVFETNIRVIGGLLGAHFMSGDTEWGKQNGYPCKGSLLNLAKDVADRLLPAFQTKTGMPYGTVNLRHGVPIGETEVTCTASVTTFYLEFLCLSAFTGDPIYKTTALKALDAMYNHRSSIGLVGNHINVQTGRWVAKEAGIGAGIDSYYEYLVKGAIFSRDPNLMDMFNEYKKVIDKYMDYDGWKFWVGMDSGGVIWPLFQSLEAFWPGLLVMIGRIDEAKHSFSNYHRVWKKYGLMPEFFNVLKGRLEDSRAAYPLRPEFIESAYYLYQATGEEYYLEVGIEVVEAIETLCRVECGYAVIGDVSTFRKEDRMESFFLAETLKYLYLLFDPQHPLNGRHPQRRIVANDSVGHACLLSTGGYVFNTEAHPLHISTVECCASLNSQKNETAGNEGEVKFDPIPVTSPLDGGVDDDLVLTKAIEQIELDDLLNVMAGNYDVVREAIPPPPVREAEKTEPQIYLVPNFSVPDNDSTYQNDPIAGCVKDLCHTATLKLYLHSTFGPFTWLNAPQKTNLFRCLTQCAKLCCPLTLPQAWHTFENYYQGEGQNSRPPVSPANLLCPAQA